MEPFTQALDVLQNKNVHWFCSSYNNIASRNYDGIFKGHFNSSLSTTGIRRFAWTEKEVLTNVQ
jgi:hypothetical protein